ncbi:unnamed protein product [Oppiella nova]|uniref:Zinc finger protein n=1 Tax=Oppiella nova TaxID=334625 RepID=A0A7R9M5E2_9ACAR|nr:unnamed protein product [Oppiella nova]CAG2171085.1 unnamed protein product [Oppiella nova]
MTTHCNTNTTSHTSKGGTKDQISTDITIPTPDNSITTSQPSRSSAGSSASREEQYFRCDLCNFNTKYRHSFRRHVTTHTNTTDGQSFTCNVCNKRLKTQEKLHNHKISMHSELIFKYKCNICDYGSQYMKNYKFHMYGHHSVVRCHNSGDDNSVTPSKVTHIGHHISRPNDTMVTPSDTTNTSLTTTSHSTTTATGEQYFRCTQRRRENESKTHETNEVIFRKLFTESTQTTVCGNWWKLSLNKMSDSNHEDFRCIECRQLFDTQQDLQIHVNSVHKKLQSNGDSIALTAIQYSCDSCDYKANTRQSLARHMTTHSSNSHSFKSKTSGVYKHSKIKSNSQMNKKSIIYNCKVCLYSSTEHRELVKHVSTQHTIVDSYTPVVSPYSTDTSVESSILGRHPKSSTRTLSTTSSINSQTTSDHMDSSSSSQTASDHTESSTSSQIIRDHIDSTISHIINEYMDSSTSSQTSHHMDISSEYNYSTGRKRLIAESLRSDTSATDSEGSDIKPYDLVWAKCQGHPWFPALVVDPNRTDTLYGEPIPPKHVVDMKTNDRNRYLVNYFDEKRLWQWLPRNSLQVMGIDTNGKKLTERRKPSDRKAVEKAFTGALEFSAQMSAIESGIE